MLELSPNHLNHLDLNDRQKVSECWEKGGGEGSDFFVYSESQSQAQSNGVNV